jgi:hypothetical protein
MRRAFRMMTRFVVAVFWLATALPSTASDACSTTAIRAAAQVSVSDGSSFDIETLYYTPDHSSIRHRYPDRPDRSTVVEGPSAWIMSGAETAAGSEFHKLFVLGHQYHAFLTDFGSILDNVRETEAIEFEGSEHSATTGDYPYGGVVHTIHGESAERPPGLVFDFGETGRIEVALSDWRRVGERDLPFRAIIDDGDRVFDYRYTSIDLEPQSPLWFYEALPAPAIDAVQIHRLHRKLLVAHCLGDAALMAELTAPAVFSANRGQLQSASNEELFERFSSLFEQLDYREYHDLIEPVIEVSESGDLGWIAVQVRAVGEMQESGQAFDNQWAWLMAVKKFDVGWLHAGNASNLAQ